MNKRRIGAEASELGWRPGQWPERTFIHLGGRSLLVTKERDEVREGELLYVLYSAGTALEVEVFND